MEITEKAIDEIISILPRMGEIEKELKANPSILDNAMMRLFLKRENKKTGRFTRPPTYTALHYEVKEILKPIAEDVQAAERKLEEFLDREEIAALDAKLSGFIEFVDMAFHKYWTSKDMTAFAIQAQEQTDDFIKQIPALLKIAKQQKAITFPSIIRKSFQYDCINTENSRPTITWLTDTIKKLYIEISKDFIKLPIPATYPLIPDALFYAITHAPHEKWTGLPVWLEVNGEPRRVVLRTTPPEAKHPQRKDYTLHNAVFAAFRDGRKEILLDDIIKTSAGTQDLDITDAMRSRAVEQLTALRAASILIFSKKSNDKEDDELLASDVEFDGLVVDIIFKDGYKKVDLIAIPLARWEEGKKKISNTSTQFLDMKRADGKRIRGEDSTILLRDYLLGHIASLKNFTRRYKANLTRYEKKKLDPKQVTPPNPPKQPNYELTAETIIEKAIGTPLNRMQGMRYRMKIIEILDYMKNENIIFDYKTEYKKKNGGKVLEKVIFMLGKPIS